MTDSFSHYADSPSSPASQAAAIAPSDSEPLGFVPKALYVGTGGSVTLRAVGDTADSIWRNVPDGAILPVRAAYVRATGTTAADLLALG